jgi:hypothetical protein
MAQSRKHNLSDDEDVPRQPRKQSKKQLDADEISGGLPFLACFSLPCLICTTGSVPNNIESKTISPTIPRALLIYS